MSNKRFSVVECPEVKKPSLAMNILINRFYNKGTAFTINERKKLGIISRLPPKVETIENQIARVMMQFELFEKPINKYQLLASVHCTNTTLFYAVICKYPELMLPIIYTPTVGEACLKFGNLYQRERGFYLSSNFKGDFYGILEETCYVDVEIIVVTDGSRILGLGDLGTNGMGISVGKCSLYVVGAGLRPRRVLPIVIDVGTNNEKLRTSPFYLGQPIKRVDDKEFYAVFDEFMESATKLWPNSVIQFEDFSNNHCFDMLERYQKKYRCFNDDIQGTGAVVSAGFLNAIKLSGIEPLKHRIVVFGAGSAAVGVAQSIARLVAYECKVPEKEVLKCFYLIDTKGLVTNTRGDVLAPHKVLMARHDVDAATSSTLKTLTDVAKFVKPTAFLGLAGDGPVFTREIADIMMKTSPRPIIFPLSNPTSKSEVDPKDAYTWTNGAAIIASGSPYPSTELNGKTYKPSQGNNMYIFPGLGLGAVLARPRYISDTVILAASKCLHDLLTEEDRANGALYPPLTKIKHVSAHIATEVILKCQEERLSNVNLPKNREELLNYVEKNMWQPVYAPEGEINDN